MLIILQELMHRTFVEVEGRAPKRHEIPKPCEHFDLIAGTGTGGLIAIMLGRLRMDIDTCKDVYIRMTKRVFETDKTFAGIPYRSTLFKASKLEEAIMECVREHTIHDDEGNDTTDGLSSTTDVRTPMSPGSAYSSMQRSPSISSRYSQIGQTPFNMRLAALKWGNPNALLYDTRENRTKTAVTAVYKGSRKSGTGQILLRSYDSRKEPPAVDNCTIWQAGRATCATALAFKPIQIGQSVFLDEGAGKYNPAPMVLDEAVCNEWPGREVGVFISIGTGKRPEGTNGQQHLWWESFVSSGVGDFAEARRKLVGKIEDCEKIHLSMKDHLAKRQVTLENYYRLNVHVGVGEFGMNEWNRLAEISTNTRMYLAEAEVQSKNFEAAAKIARIHRAKQRWERGEKGEAANPSSASFYEKRSLPSVPEPSHFAVELPAEDVSTQFRPSSHSQHLAPSAALRRASDNEKFIIPSDEYEITPRHSGDMVSPYRSSGELGPSSPPSPRLSFEEQAHQNQLPPQPGPPPSGPPPLPPKTPLQADVLPNFGPPPPKSPRRQSMVMNFNTLSAGALAELGAPVAPGAHLMGPPQGISVLPYPDSDGPPPVVNKARKPAFRVQ
ncbi:FabD/lysophospholipase-like protein [Delitschia confertaspora ATCC 74209]|uniref:FabD/lysophospholipase-like protein n=1 Tax=Delitschia confertaspora ATCC 74209 TaxID=1513339 RepID=A0A9P4JRL3_9PLEO|nr:FabD/lysophospholipase-like protein [Delitschia confertaspora ATCC 74209]